MCVISLLLFSLLILIIIVIIIAVSFLFPDSTQYSSLSLSPLSPVFFFFYIYSHRRPWAGLLVRYADAVSQPSEKRERNTCSRTSRKYKPECLASWEPTQKPRGVQSSAHETPERSSLNQTLTAWISNKNKNRLQMSQRLAWHLIHRSHALNQTAITHYNVYNTCGASYTFQVLHYKVIGFEPGQQVKCTTREREKER